MERLQLLKRIVQRVLAVGAFLIAVAMAALGVAAHLTASGHSLLLLKQATTQVGTLFAGQRTEALTLELAVFPERQHLQAQARLRLRSLHAQKRRFYFLLNDGLAIRRAQVVGSATPPAVYHLWLITVVDIGRELAADDTIELDLDYDGNPTAGGVAINAGVLDMRDVILNVDQFWYPSDLQGFFDADVAVTLPARMTLVHNGRELDRARRGDRERVHWRSERPIAGMALVAGSYRRTVATTDNSTAQLYLAADVNLDSDRVLRDMTDGNGMLTRRFGPSGFRQLTAFVSRRIRRAFNDGTGLMGISIRYFRRGDHGFNVITHEIAHNWWGGSVAEKWLAPGTGGEWIVEGLAEFSSLLAAEEHWGRDALTRLLQQEFFDPARQSVVAEMSVLDNAINEARARDTIYRKGAYVAMMLRNAIGDQAMQDTLRQVIERHRYTQISDRDVEVVASQISGKDVSEFFTDWVRTDRSADLALESSAGDQVDLQNKGAAVIPGEIALWFFKADSVLDRRNAKVGETIPFPAGAEFAVLDPQLEWADVVRHNNRWPRQAEPQFVAANSRGDLVITLGDPHPWAPTTLLHLTAGGKLAHRWEFERGLTNRPVWSQDGGRILLSLSEAGAAWPAIISLNAVDGGKNTVGYGADATLGSNGQVFAARGDRLLRFDPEGAGGFKMVAQHPGRSLETPVPSPSGEQVVYVVAYDNSLDLRICDRDGGKNRSLLAWDREPLLVRWAPDESRLYAVVGGDWDWQIWEIPVDRSAVRVVVGETAGIRDLAVSPAGNQLAFVAAPGLNNPLQPYRLYLFDLASGQPSLPDPGAADVWQIAWESPESLVAVVSAEKTPTVIPQAYAVRRIRLTDGSSEPIAIEG